MKSRLLLLVLLGAPWWSGAQAPTATVVQRGPHSRVWQWVTQDEWPGGVQLPRLHTVVELATGMHYWAGDQWVESEELIEPFPDGAVARRGPHRLIFAPNLNSRGAIDLETPDGQRLQSHVLGLAYTDAATGTSLLIAQIKDCAGEILPPNQVIYRDAFTDLKADVRYSYTLAGLEQDVLLRQSPPSPATYGLNPATTRLEIFTEFIDPPQPAKTTVVLRQETDPALRQSMFLPDLTGDILDFGTMQIRSGTAFPADAGDSAQSVPVGATWQNIEGRQFLIESVEYPTVQGYLEALPQAAVPSKARLDTIKRTAGLQTPGRTTAWARFVPAPPAAARGPKAAMRLAQAREDPKAFVLDYQTLSGSLTNYTFKADTTYFISRPLHLYGTDNVLEGGAIIKYTNSTGSTIYLEGAIDCQTTDYRPAILTSKDCPNDRLMRPG